MHSQDPPGVARRKPAGRKGANISRSWLRGYWARESLLGYAMVAPLLVVMLGIMAYPSLWAVWLSFWDKKLGLPVGQFKGLGNYLKLMSDRRFLNAASNTITFTAVAVCLKLALGMGAALILNLKLPVRNFLRSWMVLPWMAPTIVVAYAWQWMFADLGGVINHLLRSVGLIASGIAWLGRPETARLAVVVANVWLGFPFFGMNLLSGMQAIPEELYEAAKVDGASMWQRFWYVTIPSLRPIIVITTLLNTMWTLNTFDLVYVMTGGGPASATELVGLYAYRRAFLSRRLSYGIAASATIAPAVAVVIFLVLRRLERSEG